MRKLLMICALLTIIFVMTSCGGSTAPVDIPSQASAIGPPVQVLPINLDSNIIPTANRTRTFLRNTSALLPPLYPQRKQSIAYGLEYVGNVDGTFTVDGVGPYPNTWEWYLGAGRANRNIQGEVIQLVLDSSGCLDDGAAYASISIDALDHYLVPAYSPGGPFATLRPYAFDVGALVSAYQYTGNADYLTLATDLAERTTSYYTAIAYADRMINIRRSLSGWDISAYIINWYRLGELTGDAALQQWSLDCLARMWERKADWLDIPYGGWNYSSLSVGGLLETYGFLNDHTLVAQEDFFASEVLARQTEDGWWEINGYDDVQATSSCVQGLNVAHTPKSVTARERGELYLRSADIQMASGCFAGYIGDTGYTGNGDYIVSFSAEVAKALSTFYGN